MRELWKQSTMVVLGMLVALLAAGPAQAVPIVKKTLPNGLTVLVWENHTSPVVAVRAYVRTGSIYEEQYLGAGISHLFEHTLFEGTQTRNKEQINDEIQAIGGQSNAYTSKDVTVYHLTTASSYFEAAVRLTADMLQHATFPEAEVKTQQGVIHNEMNLDDDDPERVIDELFYQTAFKVHPVRYPVIGYPELFDRLTRSDILNYYHSHYTPSNTVLSIAGDVSAASALVLAQDAFKDWLRSSPVVPALPAEPLQTSVRRAVVERDNVSLGYLMVGWHTIPLQHQDLYPLDVLAQVLGGGASSRLVQELRDKRNLVTSISSYSMTPNYDAGAFIVQSTSPPANLPAVEAAILDQVRLVRDREIRPYELARAKRQIQTSFLFSKEDVADQAEQMAYDELGTGDPSFSQHYVERILAVSAPEIQQVARKYLRPDGLTTVVLRPRSSGTVTPPSETAGALETPAQIVRLPNGMRLIVRENHNNPTVGMVLMGMGGARSETPNQAGIANLAAAMLTRGTRKHTAIQLAAAVAGRGGSLSAFSGYNAWGVRSQWTTADWHTGLWLTAETALQPTFPAGELAQVKAQVLAGIQEQHDDPLSAAGLLARQLFYGSHPYGRSAYGTAAVVRRLQPQDLQRYWAGLLDPSRTVLAVFGDVHLKEVQQAAQAAFTGFPTKAAPRLPLQPVIRHQKFVEETTLRPGTTQTVLWYNFPGATLDATDRYAVLVLDAALSGADLPGGRLHARLRDNQLVYAVHAFNQSGLDAGSFAIYAATTLANRERVRSIIDEEVQKIREQPISDAELARAHSMVIAANAVDNQGNTAQAMQAAADELYGLGFRDNQHLAERINAVTAAEVLAAAQKYLQHDQAVLAIAQPEAAPAPPGAAAVPPAAAPSPVPGG